MSTELTTFRAAFYKGTRPGINGVYNRVIRWWDHGPYSHTELVFSDGISASSSFMDKGVRFKRIDYSVDKWDFIYLPQNKELAARNWFQAHEGAGYDVVGDLRFVFDFLPHSETLWFCNESAGAALDLLESWRDGPNGFAALLRMLYPHLQPGYQGNPHLA
jgi:hypothetical protein